MASRANQAVKEQRINIIYELLLTETPRQSIIQFSSVNWHISERQAENYLQSAKIILCEKLELNKDKVFNKAMRKLDFLYSMAFRQKQFKVCLDITKTQLEMFDAIKHPGVIDEETTFNVRLVNDDGEECSM
jgi:hypothetical protein